MGLARFFLAFLLLLPSLALAGEAVVDTVVEADSARLTIAWPAPIAVQKQVVAKGYLLTLDHSLPDLGGALAVLPPALGAVKVMDDRRLRLTPAADATVGIKVLNGRKLVVAFERLPLKAAHPPFPKGEHAGQRSPAHQAVKTAEVRHAKVPHAPVDAHGNADDAGGGDDMREVGFDLRTHADLSHDEAPTATDPPELARFIPFEVGSLRVEARRRDGGLDLHFCWPGPVPAAAFERGGDLWIAFAAYADAIAADRRNMIEEAGSFIRSIHQERHPEGTVLRLTLVRPLEAAMTPGADGWTLRLGEGAAPPRPVPLRPSPDGAFFVDGEAVLDLPQSPEGEALRLALASDGPVTVPSADHDGVRFLKAIQGGVIQPEAAGVRVDLTVQGVRVGPSLVPAPVPTQASTLKARPTAAIDVHAPAPAPRPVASPDTPHAAIPARPTEPIGLARVTSDHAPDFAAQRQAILAGLPGDPALGRAARWRALARVYLARRLPEEAYALLQGDEGDEAQALRGVALLLMDRPAKAAQGLAPFAAVLDPELDLWRGVLAAQEGRWEEAHTRLQAAAPLLEGYSKDLQAEVGLLGARAAVETGEVGAAFDLSRRLKALPLSARDEARRRLIEADAYRREGDLDRATATWEAMEGSPLAEKGEAARAEAAALRAAGRIDAAGAADLLGRGAALWRGLANEASLLRALADHEKAAGRTGEALDRLARLQDLAAEQDAAPLLRERGKLLLAAVDGTARGTPGALDNLLLLRRHRDALPDGDEATGSLRRLKDRLAIEGFIGPAAGLASEFGLSSEAGLDPMGEPVGDPLALYAGLLAAGEPKRARLALERVSPLDLPQAAETAFAGGDWAGVVQAAGPVAASLDPARPLDEAESLLVLRLAVALARRNDASAARRLAARFKGALGQGRYEALLALLARPDLDGDTARVVPLIGVWAEGTRNGLAGLGG